MKDLFLNNGINLTDNQLEKFENFRDLLLFYNQKFNITTITERKEVNIKHFLDSALSKDFFVENSKVLEIGSGGGFPSIPLMIIREDLTFNLLEATGKKCIFLKEVVKTLNLKAEVLNGRAEDFAKDISLREKFDHVTARAVARMNTLLEYSLPFVKKGGSFIALKGNANEELEESKNALKILGGRVKQVKNYSLPLDEANRMIIEIEKINSTPKEYPRGNGKERKNPL